MTVEEIRRRGRASRHYYWRCWALRQGATDDQAWWCAVAAIKAYNEGKARPYWLAPFIAAELAYLRANADTFARLDARQWAGVPDFAPVVDQGYELDDDQEVA